MESNVMFSGFSPRMLSLEMPQNTQNTVQFQHPHPYPIPTNQPTNDNNQTQPIYPPYPSKPKQLSPVPDHDEDRGSGSGSGCNPEDSIETDGKRKFSQWHRMKWTDTMVRLLIMAVFYIGDEAGSTDQTESKKKSTGAMLQKKGKWKSVSKAMVEKGFSVSPQQCEDKFNDLNKRYKRVNDILGKGTACRVVENQALLETMDNVTPKLKNEVKKLLNSKHLFFREMCAYHNSCGHGHGEQSQQQQQPQAQQKMSRIVESESESESEWESDKEESRKKKEKRECLLTEVKLIREEVLRVVEDTGKSVLEKKEWLRKKGLEIEERKIGYEWEALEMEKERVKWMRYRSKKEREMEKAKLENQRRRLEVERMGLVLRRREIELMEGHGSSSKRVDPSVVIG